MKSWNMAPRQQAWRAPWDKQVKRMRKACEDKERLKTTLLDLERSKWSWKGDSRRWMVAVSKLRRKSPNSKPKRNKPVLCTNFCCKNSVFGLIVTPHNKLLTLQFFHCFVACCCHFFNFLCAGSSLILPNRSVLCCWCCCIVLHL